MPRGCRICRYWEKYPYRLNDKLFFETKARQNTSLRQLELLLESYGLRCKKDLINRHLKKCLGFDVERKIEREAKRGKGIRRKLSFFTPKRKEPKVAEACKHSHVLPFYDLSRERVFARCTDCGEVLRGSVDPHFRRRNRERNLVIINALRGRRR